LPLGVVSTWQVWRHNFAPLAMLQWEFLPYDVLFYVVAGIWLLNLATSTIWLKHFRFGPMEWAWRSLTYWKRQPMRRALAATEPGVMALEG
jgi:uncharacterized membrane protein YeiB